MVELYFLIKGAIIGFIVSLPIGPVSLLCIGRAISKGQLAGFATGFGAVIGDLFYASIAAFGLSFVIHFLREEEFWFRLVGGGFLILMGLYVYFKKIKPASKASEEVKHLGEAFASGLLIDISNPVIILAYLAIFSGFGLSPPNAHFFSAISLIIGVATGAALWWSLLVLLISSYRTKINENGLAILSKIGAILLMAFGLFVIYSSFFVVPFLKGTF